MQQHGGFVQPGPLEGSKLTLPAQTLAGNDGSYRDQVKGIALGTGLSMSGGVLRAVGSAFDGAVATWADLPVGLVTPVVESVYLVRNGSGVWLLNRKKSGLYQRVALTGDRAADWNYLGEWLEEFSDANFEVWHDDDTTRGLKFSLADQATGTTVTVRSNDLETLGTMAAGWSGVSGHLLRTDNPHAVTAAQVGLGSVDNTRDADKPVSTAQAAAIGARAPLVHGHAAEDISDSTYVGRSLLTAASAAAQRNLIGVTPWATNQWTDGTTSDIPEGTQLYFTNARADARIAAQKGQAEGLAPLDAGGKVPTAHLPDSLVGQVIYKGLWDASTNTPTLPTASAAQGYYYITSVAGVYAGIAFDVGDWCISDGSTWGKVDNSDAITSFAGRTGAILPIPSDYSAFYLGLNAQADDSARLGGQLPSYYSQAGHTHNYAGSSTPGGAATSALECTGNATTATALATARTLTIGNKANTFDGSADKAWTLAEIGAIDGAQTSFTPTVNFETPSAGMALSVINASSSRAGAVVFVRIALVISNKGTGGAGALIISGLPEEVKAVPAYGIYLGVAWYNGSNTYAGAIGTDSIYVDKQFSAVSNGDYAQICITYERA